MGKTVDQVAQTQRIDADKIVRILRFFPHPLFVVVELLLRDADLLFENTGEQPLTNFASTLGNRRPTNWLARFLFFVNLVSTSGTNQHPSIPLQVAL